MIVPGLLLFLSFLLCVKLTRTNCFRHATRLDSEGFNLIYSYSLQFTVTTARLASIWSVHNGAFLALYTRTTAIIKHTRCATRQQTKPAKCLWKMQQQRQRQQQQRQQRRQGRQQHQLSSGMGRTLLNCVAVVVVVNCANDAAACLAEDLTRLG